jgi:hypothetical protein
MPNDTLFIAFKRDYFTLKCGRPADFMVTQDSTGTDIIYSNEVSFKIEKNR